MEVLMLSVRFVSAVMASLACFISSNSSLSAAEGPPTVQVETLTLTELSDEFTYPARITSRIQGAVTADIDGVVVKVVASLGQRVTRGAALFSIKNTDPVYEYVPVTVTSPVSGVVSVVDVSEGATVHKGQKLGSVVDPSQILIEVEIPASDLSFFRRGLKGQFVLSETQKINVTVAGVSPLVDPVTGTASAQLKPETAKIPLGVIGRAVFKTNVRKSLQIVEHAIVLRGRESFVRVVVDSKATLVPVTVASTHKGMTEISTGITPGTVVVVGTSRFITDGQVVTIQQSDVAKK
jgi:multidrug efflux pump subunit AcrA (membrane-fusion protein)